jgi:hypothetical protein
MKRGAEPFGLVDWRFRMAAEKLRDRTKSLAQKTLAAVEAVERRIVNGESDAAIRSAVEQLRGAIESLRALEAAVSLENQTKQLIAHLDERVRAMEKLIAAEPVG